MSLITLKELEHCLDDATADEWQLTLSIDGAQFGAPGNYVLGTLNRRERIFKLDLSQEPHTAAGAAQWNNADFERWSEGWKAVLTSIGVLAPRIDPFALNALLSNREHLCLIADTGAAASGIVDWLSYALWNRRVELVLNSVVERELFGWSDQDGFYKKAPSEWQMRVKYRLARHLSETPPQNLVVRRPAPEEKAALMLAKLRIPGQKSPDADILLIEQARDVLQTQPSTVRTLYVTSDRAHARSAVAILPPQNVLFAPPAHIDVKQPILGMAAFWQPASGFGALRLLSFAEIVWHLLSASDSVVLTGTNVEIKIETVLHDNGCPSDWVNPQLDVQVSSLAPSVPTTPITTNDTSTEAILLPSPMPAGSPIASLGLRPTPSIIRAYLNSAIEGMTVPVPPTTQELQRESFRLLAQLGVFQEDGTPIPTSKLMQAVKENDWDQVHSHFLRSKAYEKVLDALRADPTLKFTGRSGTQVSFARHLGQIAKADPQGLFLVGDRLLKAEDFIAFIEDVLPVPRMDYPIAEVCPLALMELGITPMRFEKALQRLLDSGYNEVSLETGGSVGKGTIESVFYFNGKEIIEQEVSTAALYFGGDRPIKSLRRRG